MASETKTDTTTTENPAPTPESAERQAEISAAVAAREAELQEKFRQQMEGLEKSRDTLLSEKKAATDESRTLKSIIGDRNPETVMKTLRAIDESELKSYLESGEIEKYNSKLTERVRAEAEAERQSMTKAIEEREKRIAEQDARIHKLTVHGDVLKAFRASGGKESEAAQEFATTIADRYYSVNEQGEKEVRDPRTGQLLMGKTGMMTEAEFCQQILRRDADLLFEPVQGSGASGGASGAATKKYSDMTPDERGQYARTYGDEALAALT